MLSELRCRAANAWQMWQAAAGRWERWSQCLPLLGAGLDELDDPSAIGRGLAGLPAAPGLAMRLQRRLEHAKTATIVVLDVPPAAGVRAAAALMVDEVAHPLLQLGRWPYAEAVLPARPLVDVLLVEAARLGESVMPHVVLVLDGERERSRLGGPGRRADNRFALHPDDLPTAEALVAAGIGCVMDVRRRQAAVPRVLARGLYPACMVAGLAVDSVTLA